MPKRRFDIYDPLNLADPEKNGIIPSQTEWSLATPNLTRSENVLLVASNSSLTESMIVKFRWRPRQSSDGDQVVTLISRFSLMLDGDLYEFEDNEIYEPQLSSVRPSFITRYGSKASKLRLIIAAPYRRMRLLFTGYVTNKTTSKRVFLKLNCVIGPISVVFDFLDPDNAAYHDRHEYKIKMEADILFIDENDTKIKREITCRGFYARHFVSGSSATKRLYAMIDNGQAFHVGNFTNKKVDFGYTTFEIHPIVTAIEKHINLDWESIGDETQSFQFDISGSGMDFKCSGTRHADNAPGWFKVEFNERPGWGWISLDDDTVETPEMLEAMASSLESLEKRKRLQLKRLDVDETDQTPLVVSISDSACSSDKHVGSKASSLNHLVSLAEDVEKSIGCNYKVPNGFVLTKYTHELIIKDNPNIVESIGKLHQLVAEGQLDSLRDECRKIEDMVQGLVLPQPISDKLVELFMKHYGNLDSINQINFAVRSSSWGEDEEDMSAAGQLRTILNVRGLDALAKASMACYASKFSYENIEYKRQHGLPFDMPMAIVIQEMVACEKAGVMFTCDPTTGDDSIMTITANYGLGESVVSAQADPDSIKVRVDPNGHDLSIKQIDIGQKKVISDENGTNNQHNHDLSKCCMSDDEILRVARVGHGLKDLIGSGQLDIEWGFLNNQLYLFQSRPVTGLESMTLLELMHECERPSQGEKIYYTRANIGEVQPFGSSPFNVTYSLFFWNVIGAKLFLRLQNKVNFLPNCTNEIFYENYHTFFNLQGSLILPQGVEKTVVHKAMDIAFFGHELPPQTEIIKASQGFPKLPELFEGSNYYWATFFLRLMPLRTVERERSGINRLEISVQNNKLATGYETNKMQGLFNQLKSVYDGHTKSWYNHIFVIRLSSACNIALTGFLSQYIKDAIQLTAATNKFLAITPDVLSAQIPAQISKIAQLIRSMGDEEVDKVVNMTNDNDLLNYITNSAESDDSYRKSLANEFKAFMQKFGHRCYNEFEIQTDAWRDNPKQIVEMIRQNCRSKFKVENNKLETIDQVIDSLGIQISLSDRLKLKYLLVPKSQAMLASREITKDLLIKLVDISRQASRSLAKEMQRNLRIPDADLFYYLYYDEIDPLIRDYQPSVVVQAIRRRNMFKKMFAKPWQYDEIITSIVPNHLKPSKEIAEELEKAPKLFGTPASSGRVQGKICFVDGFSDINRVEPGTILLTHSTDIGFSPIFPIISGIITEVGGLISHGAVVAREYGLPSIIGIADVTKILKDGEEIILDADNGLIIRLDLSKGSDPKPVNGEGSMQSNGHTGI